MANQVNPPPQLKIPANILKDPQWLAYERQRDVILFQLWRKLGGNSDPVSEIGNDGISNFSSVLQQVLKQIGGLPKFTCDTTGFTADSTEWTADKDTV